MSYQEAMGWNNDSGFSKEGRKKLYMPYCYPLRIESYTHTLTWLEKFRIYMPLTVNL